MNSLVTRLTAWGPLITTVFVMLNYWGACAMAVMSGDTTLLTTTVTAGVTMAGAGVGYWLGTSNSSRKKDDVLQEATRALAVSTPPSPVASGQQ